MVTGGVTGSLVSYLLRQQGVSPHYIANQRALLLLPGSLFFLWSPVTDFLLRRRTWFLASSAAAARAVMLPLETKNYASRVRDVVVDRVLPDPAGFRGAGRAGGALMRQDQKTRVGCFLQAGNLAGGALSGGGLLLLASHVSKLTLGVAAQRSHSSGFAGAPAPRACGGKT